MNKFWRRIFKTERILEPPILERAKIVRVVEGVDNVTMAPCCDEPDIQVVGNWYLEHIDLLTYVLEPTKTQNTGISGPRFFDVFIKGYSKKVVAVLDICDLRVFERAACLNCSACFNKKEYLEALLGEIRRVEEIQNREELAEKICKGEI